MSSRAAATTDNYYGGSGVLSGSNWSTSPAGPFNAAFNTRGGGIAHFDIAGSQAAGANGIVVAGISATANFSITGSPAGSITNAPNGVVPISVSTGVTLDFGSQAFTGSGKAGYTKSGSGATLSLSDLGSTLLSAGTKFTLVSYAQTWDGGTFSGKADDSRLTVGTNHFVINYNDTGGTGLYGKYVTLTAAVPEANAFLFGALAISVAGLVFCGRRWVNRCRAVTMVADGPTEEAIPA